MRKYIYKFHSPDDELRKEKPRDLKEAKRIIKKYPQTYGTCIQKLKRKDNFLEPIKSYEINKKDTKRSFFIEK